jgi:hypothetical protein
MQKPENELHIDTILNKYRVTRKIMSGILCQAFFNLLVFLIYCYEQKSFIAPA